MIRFKNSDLRSKKIYYSLNYSSSLFLILITLILVFLYSYNNVNAQINSSGLAISIPFKDSDTQIGDIICSYKDGNQKCSSEYDTGIFGVITDRASAEIKDTELKNSRLIVTSGVTKVRISSQNGNIKEGDFITSSPVKGVGMKAVKNGYVLGSSLENYNNSDVNSVGMIQVSLNIHPESSLTGSRGNLLQFIRQGVSVPIFDPVESLRYLLAVAIVLVSFTLGMIYFGKASRAGIEAIGRNPLAKRVIQFTVVMNIVLTLVIVMVGLGIAYLILVL